MSLNVSNLSNRFVDRQYKTCIAYKNVVQHRGVFHGEDYASDQVYSAFTFQVSLAFCISQIIYFVLRPLKQPKVVSNVLTGIMLGPSVLGRNKKLWQKLFPPEEMVVVNTMAYLGALYFIFLVSIKMDRDRMLKKAMKTWKISLICLVVPFTITILLFRLLHNYIPGVKKGLFHYLLSFMLSQTFFSVVAPAVTELNLLNSELGQLAISVSIFSEFFSWFNLTVAIFFQKGVKQLVLTEVSLCLLLSFLFFIIRPSVRWIIKKTPEGKPVEQIYIIAVLLLTLIIGVLTAILGSTFVLGALLTGLFIPAGSPVGSAVIEKCEIIISNILLPFFYIRMGQLVNVYSITDWKEFFAFQMILIAGYLAKVAGGLLSSFSQTSLRNATLFSLIVNSKGIIELLVVVLWRLDGLFDEQTSTMIVLSNTLLTAIVTPLISIYKPQERLEASATNEQHMRTLQTTPINAELRIVCCIHFEENIPGINALLKACSADGISPTCAYVIHLVELVGSATPVVAPYHFQKRKIKENSTDRIMRAVTKYMESWGVSIIIQPLKMIAPYNTMHETIYRLAWDNFVPFILLPFHRSYQIHQRTASLQQFNLKIQEYAPSTVGIFVDKGLPRSFRSTLFSYNIAVFFVGGQDDREALALATRMSVHPGVSITLFRIHLMKEEQRNEGGNPLDDIVVNEFMTKNIYNSSVVCRELVANDPAELVDGFRSIENIYDLVIAGKKQEMGSKFEIEMKPWVEYEELGIIGDLFASPDCGEFMSVLVIQCFGRVEEDVLGKAHDTNERFSSLSKLCDREQEVHEERNPIICTKV